MSYRCSLPISRMSRKPRVVSSAVGAPVRSMIALVTRVVPCTRIERSPTPTPASRHRSTSPRRAPSAGSGVVVRTLWRRSSPVVSLRRTKSVKVPPMSRPTRNPRIEDPNLCSTPRFNRPLGVRILWPRSLFLLPLFCSSLTLALFHASIGLRSALHPAGTASAAPEPSRPSIAILQLWLLPSVSRGHLELRSIPGAELACISRGDRGDHRRPAEIAPRRPHGRVHRFADSEGRHLPMQSRKVLESALILLVIAALAESLVFSTSAAPRRGGALRVAEIGEPLTLDTVATTADLTSIITLPIFEELFTFDAGFRVQPLLADP